MMTRLGAIRAMAVMMAAGLLAPAQGEDFGPEPAWSADFAIPSGCNGDVAAVAEAPDGTVYLGGNFTACGDVAANRVIRFDPETETWHPLGGGADNGTSGTVLALAADAGGVWVGGDFGRAGGQSAANLAHFVGGAWEFPGGGLTVSGAAAGAEVRALLQVDTVLYVGGRFDAAGGVSATNVASLQAGVWETLGGGVDQVVLALAEGGGEIYAGTGRLSPPLDTGSVRRFDGAWQTVGMANGVVNALAASPGGVVAGGEFTEIGEVAARRVARLDGAEWQALGEETDGVNGPVLALLAEGGEVLAAGAFTQAGGVPASRLARFDGQAWSAVRTVFEPEEEGEPPPPPLPDGVNRSVRALAGEPGRFYAGGFFDTAGGALANHATVWDGEFFQALGPAAGLGLNGLVRALVWHDGALIAGGDFTRAGTVPAARIARLAGGQWTPLGAGMDGAVHALASDGENLFAAGDFERAGGSVRNFIARWDGENWFGLGPAAAPGLAGEVFALGLDGEALFAAGAFEETAAGLEVNRIAQWRNGAWSTLGPASAPGVDDWVQALSFREGVLHLGGFFDNAGNVPASRVARFDLAGFSALGAGLDGEAVRALLAVGGDLYAGGRINSAGGTGGLAVWDGANWSDPGAGLGFDTVRALEFAAGSVIVGGDFSEIGLDGGRIAAGRVAAFDGQDYTALGPGIGGVATEVRALAWTPEGLYVGGRFGQAGPHTAGHLSLWRSEILFADGFEAEPES